MQILDKTAEQSASKVNNDTLEPLYIIIPAHNEEAYIGPCLDALMNQDDAAGPAKIIVAANACTDQTAQIVRSQQTRFSARGWHLELLSIAAPGKLNAINQADRASADTMRIYLDADVICDPELFGQLRVALSKPEPVYATGTLQVTRPQSWISRAYANLWVRLPFVQSGAVGAGLFAVNATGRQRWGEFPAIISDDTFVRLHFTPKERKEVPACYHWPMVEGFSNLVQVRRRQDAGVKEIARLYPALVQNDAKQILAKSDYLKLFLTAPISFVIYTFIQCVVRLRSSGSDWTRGR